MGVQTSRIQIQIKIIAYQRFVFLPIITGLVGNQHAGI